MLVLQLINSEKSCVCSSSETVAPKMKIWPGYMRLLLCQTNSASDEAGHDHASGWNARGLITASAADIPANLIQVMTSAGEICFESVKLSQVRAVPHPFSRLCGCYASLGRAALLYSAYVQR